MYVATKFKSKGGHVAPGRSKRKEVVHWGRYDWEKKY